MIISLVASKQSVSLSDTSVFKQSCMSYIILSCDSVLQHSDLIFVDGLAHHMNFHDDRRDEHIAKHHGTQLGDFCVQR